MDAKVALLLATFGVAEEVAILKQLYFKMMQYNIILNKWMVQEVKTRR
ncbi:hypothetical protein [Brevibacillus laterosporus]|nr:hypothetical protein [Brevibacillus laterosporus]